MKVTFQYSALTPKNVVVNGVISAESKDLALRGIRDQQLRPISVAEQGSIFKITNIFIKRPPQRLPFFRSYAALATAGTSTEETFDLLVQQARSVGGKGLMSKMPWVREPRERFITSVESISREVMSGSTLHGALAKRPNEFSDIEAAMCQIGHEAGTLPKILRELATFLERDRKFGKQLSDALLYPIIVAFFSIVMTIYMVVALIPQFANMYTSFGVPLPPIMAAMMFFSHLLTNPIFIVLCILGIGGGIYGLIRMLGTPKGALMFDSIRVSIPVIGELFSKSVVARFARVMAMLFDAGKSPLRSVEITIPVVGSPVYQKALTEMRDALGEGRVANLYEAMINTRRFEPLLTGFIKVGVKAGNLPEMFTKVAEYYEEDVESLASQIPTVVQTLMTILMGGVVGLIAYAVYVPLAHLTTSIH